MPKYPLSSRQIKTLSKYPKKSVNELSAELNRSPRTIRYYLKQLDIWVPTLKRKTWTISEVSDLRQFCAQNFPLTKKNWAEIKAKFGLTSTQAKYAVDRYVRGVR